MTEDIFDMSNVRIFNKEIEKKKMGDVYTLLCFRSAELSKAFSLRNLCYSKISVVMLLGTYRISGVSRKLESKRKNMTLHICCIFKQLKCHTYLMQKKSKTIVEFSRP